MKRNLSSLRILTAALSCSISATAQAHHNHVTFYDQCTSVTIEGTVRSAQFTGPHAKLVVRLDNGTTHVVDWMTPNNLRQNGILEPAREALTPGARVSVTGNPIRAVAEIRAQLPSFAGDVDPNTLDAKLIRLVDDSFRWGAQPANPVLCKDR